MGQLREEYIETGKVRFVYKHFAILGQESNRAAEASECAAEQGRFWAFHDRVFEDQAKISSALNSEQLVTLADDIGLDTDAFKQCLSGGQYSLQIALETQSVSALGIRGTPAFLVNGVYVSGAQSFAVFQEIIEDQLALMELEP